MGLVLGLPKGINSPVLDEMDIIAGKLNNQFVISGIDPKIPSNLADKNYIVFLEYVQAISTFTLKDASGNTIINGIASPLDLSYAPLRIDGGVEILGTITIAKGFVIIRNKIEGV